jgi:hypothetical protein
MKKVLLITIAIGPQYVQLYNFFFRKSHENYAKKHNYDFKIITDFISSETKYPIKHNGLISFNKILVCSQDFSEKYDYIIFIDADIIINKNAPALHDYYNWGDKIGIIDEYSQPTNELRIKLQKLNGWEDSANKYYKLAGLDIETTKLLNTGVLVMQPKIHSVFLKSIYEKYAEIAVNHSRGFHFEQSCIGYELQKNNKALIIDNKWNAVWTLYRDVNWYSNNENMSALQQAYEDHFFLHFAGKADYMLIPKLRI